MGLDVMLETGLGKTAPSVVLSSQHYQYQLMSVTYARHRGGQILPPLPRMRESAWEAGASPA